MKEKLMDIFGGSIDSPRKMTASTKATPLEDQDATGEDTKSVATAHERINGYNCIFPSKRNLEWEYRKFLDTAKDFYEAFTGSYTHRRDPRREKTIPKITGKWESSMAMRERDDNMRANSFGGKHFSTLSRQNSPDLTNKYIEK